RDKLVTGVQTCALPISPAEDGGVDHAGPRRAAALGDRRAVEDERLARLGRPLGRLPQFRRLRQADFNRRDAVVQRQVEEVLALRSEERRVGKECRAEWW